MTTHSAVGAVRLRIGSSSAESDRAVGRLAQITDCDIEMELLVAVVGPGGLRVVVDAAEAERQSVRDDHRVVGLVVFDFPVEHLRPERSHGAGVGAVDVDHHQRRCSRGRILCGGCHVGDLTNVEWGGSCTDQTRTTAPAPCQSADGEPNSWRGVSPPRRRVSLARWAMVDVSGVRGHVGEPQFGIRIAPRQGALQSQDRAAVSMVRSRNRVCTDDAGCGW